MSRRLANTALLLVLATSRSILGAPLDEPIKPIPATSKQDPARVEIGRQLFNDVRLSANNRTACASCHDLVNGGADGRARSSLRNVAVTAPYFHDAGAKTLEDAVDVMFTYQVGRVASSEDRRAIVSFLNTLTGELEGKR